MAHRWPPAAGFSLRAPKGRSNLAARPRYSRRHERVVGRGSRVTGRGSRVAGRAAGVWRRCHCERRRRGAGVACGGPHLAARPRSPRRSHTLSTRRRRERRGTRRDGNPGGSAFCIADINSLLVGLQERSEHETRRRRSACPPRPARLCVERAALGSPELPLGPLIPTAILGLVKNQVAHLEHPAT
jgi:hypothetical protein